MGVNAGVKKTSTISNTGKTNVSKGGNRELVKGAVAVGGGAVRYVAAGKIITGELSGLGLGNKTFEVGTAKGLIELASKYEALLMYKCLVLGDAETC